MSKENFPHAVNEQKKAALEIEAKSILLPQLAKKDLHRPFYHEHKDDANFLSIKKMLTKHPDLVSETNLQELALAQNMLTPDSFKRLISVYNLNELHTLTTTWKEINQRARSEPEELLLENVGHALESIALLNEKRAQWQQADFLDWPEDREEQLTAQPTEAPHPSNALARLKPLNQIIKSLDDQIDLAKQTGAQAEKIAPFLLKLMGQLEAVYKRPEFTESPEIADELAQLEALLGDFESEIILLDPVKKEAAWASLGADLKAMCGRLFHLAAQVNYPDPAHLNPDRLQYYVQVKNNLPLAQQLTWLPQVYQFASDQQARLTWENRVLEAGNIKEFKANMAILEAWFDQYQPVLNVLVKQKKDKLLTQFWQSVTGLWQALKRKQTKYNRPPEIGEQVDINKDAVKGIRWQHSLVIRLKMLHTHFQQLKERFSDEAEIEPLE